MINFILVSKIKKIKHYFDHFQVLCRSYGKYPYPISPAEKGGGACALYVPISTPFPKRNKIICSLFLVLSNGYCRAAFFNCESIQCSLFLPQVSSCKHFQENKIFANRLFNNGLNEIILNIFT